MKRHPYLLAVIAVALLVAGLLAWRQAEYQTESYAGKHTRDWAWQLLNAQALSVESNRVEAIAALRALGPRALPPLRRMLRKRDTFYDDAVVKLARSLPVDQRYALLRQLRPGQALAHRLAAINALSTIGPAARAMGPELGAALHDPVGQVRWDASRALLAIGEDGLAMLIQATTDTNAAVRHAAVFALGEALTNAPQIVPALFDALLDSDANVRGSAVYAIGRLGQNVVPMLLNRLASTNAAVQVAALRALADVRPPLRLIATNLFDIATSSTGELRRLSIETIGALRLPQSNLVNLVVAALGDPDPALRLTAIKATGQVNWKAGHALPQLEEFTRSANPTEREAAARTLGMFGSRARQSVPALQPLLEDRSPLVRAAATNALTQINGTPANLP